MAELRGGTTIGGFTAIHSGLKNAYFGGSLTIYGNSKIESDGRAYFGTTSQRSNYRFMVHGSGDIWHAMIGDIGAGIIKIGGNTSSGAVIQAANETNNVVRDLYLQRDGGKVGINTNAPAYPLDVAGDAQVRGWLRVTGTQGLYFQSYGGGWYMTDGTWIRNYSSKPLSINSYISIGGNENNSATGGLSLGNQAVDFSPTTGNWTTGGTTLLLNALNYSVIGFHDAGSRVDFIRVGAGIMELGYNGGWGNASVRVPGTLVIPVGTDKYAT